MKLFWIGMDSEEVSLPCALRHVYGNLSQIQSHFTSVVNDKNCHLR